jgi:hypothetical protein
MSIQRQESGALARGREKPVQRLLQPPAKIPYTTPNAMSPANEWERTPHNMNVAIDVERRVVSAKIHGLSLSDRYPIASRPIIDAATEFNNEIGTVDRMPRSVPFNIASVTAEFEELTCRSLANAGRKYTSCINSGRPENRKLTR